MKKVEKYLVTKEMTNHLKKMKQLNQVKEMLTNGALKDWFAQGNVLKKLFGQLSEKQKMLNLSAPKEKLNEVPGQDMGTEQLFEEETNPLNGEGFGVKQMSNEDLSEAGQDVRSQAGHLKSQANPHRDRIDAILYDEIKQRQIGGGMARPR